MFRNFLLPALAAAALAGCATGYSYRNGNGGDYYHGQPRTEYRYYDPYGFQRSFGYDSYGYGSYAPRYYYDRYGRLVYWSPYGYYGTPYGSGSGWYQPRPPHRHDGDHHDDRQDDGARAGSRPPWRNIGGVLPPPAPITADDDDATPRVRRQRSLYTQPTPAPRRERMIAPPVSPTGSDGGGGSRLDRAIRGTKAAAADD